MKTWTTTLLVLGALAAPSFAQGTESKDATPQAWIERLGDEAYSQRRDAERALEKMGEKAVPALKQAADSHGDPEVQWRAQRLLDRIRSSDGAIDDEEAWRLPPLWKPRDLDSMFGSVFDRLERDFGVDVPRRSFFDDSFYKDLRQQMRALEEQFAKAGKVGAGADAQSKALEMHVGPDGVRVEVRERDASGEAIVETYEAPDLDTFREKYPEVARQYLDRDGEAFTWKLDPKEFFADLPLLGRATDASTETGPKLGVTVRPVGSDLRHFLGLEVGQGLLVEKVTPGSLAARLGIEPRDVILEIEGEAVGSAADVRRALFGADATIDVRVNRRGGELELEAEHHLVGTVVRDRAES